MSAAATAAPAQGGGAESGWRWPAAAAGLASASYLLARAVELGPRQGPWAYWPILGLLCGIFTRRPLREWGRIALAAAAAQTLTVYLVRGDLAGGATVVGALAGAAEAMLGASLLRRAETPAEPLGSPRDLAVFLVGVVLLVPLAITPISAYGYALGLHLSFRTAWWPLFIGNALSLLVFAPLTAFPWRGAPGERPAWTAGLGEVALCQASILALSLLTFAGRGHWLWYLVLPYVMLPLLVWAALRCGPHWTAASVVTLATVSAWFMARGPWPLADAHDVPLDKRVLEWQAYLAFAAFTALLLSTLTEQRRRSFARLALQGAIQRAVFESSSATIALKDLQHRYVLVNHAAELAMGMPREQILGRTPSEVLRPSDAAVVQAHDLRVLERGEPLTFEEPLHVGGEVRHYLMTRFPVRDEKGEIRYVGYIGRDDTLERELSSRLQRLTRVEVMGQLAAGLAHDVNNLLTVIVTNAAVLQEGSSPSDAAALVAEVGDAGKRAARLTGRLLALGRRKPASGGEPAEVDEAVDAIAPLLRALVRDNVDLSLRLGAHGASVSVDRSEIEQIVLNLVSNARDAIACEGNIAIATEVVPAAVVEGRREGADAERWLRLRVSDTGSGMDPATLGRMFEPFFTTKEEAKGTGLGLYTTSLLVREAGGVIRASSTPGKGSAFVVDLPLSPRGPSA